MTEVIAENTTVAADLIAAVSGLRRALRRRVGRTGGVAELSEAQREVVRAVRRQPGLRVGDVATELHLAGNTVSTLVTGLCTAGWLRREPDPEDRRAALLFLTPPAEERVAEWRDRRLAILRDALASLDEDDRTHIARALPSLQRVVARLQETS